MRCDTLNVLFLASEAEPLVKVGGLADVAGSLPRALQKLSSEEAGSKKIEVRLVLPYHSAIRKKLPEPAFLCEFDIPVKNGWIPAQAYFVEINGIRTYLISGLPIPADGPVYSADPSIDGPKFIFFSLAALQLIKELDWQPDILHANDWHTAIAVYQLNALRKAEPFYQKIKSVLTVHNLPFMGTGTETAFTLFNLSPSPDSMLPQWASKTPLPLGLLAADRIVTVSPSYSREILTPAYGCGLDQFLRNRQESVSGIVNGIDLDSWDPARDTTIPTNYSLNNLSARGENKAALVNDFDLDRDPNLPLIILITRMDPQKGIDLAIEGLRRCMDIPWQAILLGAGDPALENYCLQLEQEIPDRVRSIVRFDIPLARRMYAGADILLMPSRYEPCGLTQMMAMRYGCVPLARATGGLCDTIQDVGVFPDTGTGFLFEPAQADALASKLRYALQVFPDQNRWCGIQERGMKQDFSWQRSALAYAAIYNDLMEEKR